MMNLCRESIHSYSILWNFNRIEAYWSSVVAFRRSLCIANTQDASEYLLWQDYGRFIIAIINDILTTIDKRNTMSYIRTDVDRLNLITWVQHLLTYCVFVHESLKSIQLQDFLFASGRC